MELWLYETNFDRLSVVDIFESLIWTDRYQECGDFELYLAASSDALSSLRTGRYLDFNNSEHVMIIEDIKLNTNIDEGDRITVTGRSLESILSRRIIWDLTTLSGNLQNSIQKLLNENVINPKDSKRKISNFIFKKSTDTRITSLTLEAQFFGDNLYDAIVAICVEAGIGFKITLNSSKQFVFELYCGDDRSYSQNKLPYVAFSDEFDNIISTDYSEELSQVKTYALIAGEGEGIERKTAQIGTQDTGLNRKELFVDSRERSTDAEGEPLKDYQYEEILQQEGLQELAANNSGLIHFDCQIDTNAEFKYGEDFFTGDILSVASSYGIERKVRIVEYIQNQDINGIKAYPKFEILEEE